MNKPFAEATNRAEMDAWCEAGKPSFWELLRRAKASRFAWNPRRATVNDAGER